MINCIAIDDEPLALTQLTGYISRVPFLNLVASCQDAFDAMSVLSAQKIDLMFVDINMPDLNGMDFVRSLTEKPLVIFTTAYSEYAVEGFKVDALDYLLKPFGFQDFLKAVDKAYKWWEFRTKGHGTVAPPSTPSELSFNDGTLFVKSDYRVTRINLADIKYIDISDTFHRKSNSRLNTEVSNHRNIYKIMDTVTHIAFIIIILICHKIIILPCSTGHI